MAKPPLQLVLLAGDQRPVVLAAEHLAEGRDVPEQRARRLHVLHEAPQLGERVLHRRRREQQDRRRAQEAADAVRHQRLVGGLVVESVASVALVQAGEDLVRLVDDDQVERWHGAEELGAAFASGELAADQVHARCDEVRLILARLDAEQVEQLVLPLADQRLRDDQQDALRAFGPALGDHQAGLDRLSEADLVGEDAAAFAETPEREDHRVDLVGVGIDARLPLRRRVALAVVRPTDADEVLGEHAKVEWMNHCTAECPGIFQIRSPIDCSIPTSRPDSPGPLSLYVDVSETDVEPKSA